MVTTVDTPYSSETPAFVQTIEERIAEANETLFRDPIAALKLVNEALRLIDDSGKFESRGRALRVRAMVHGTSGDMEAADADFRAALALARCSQDTLLESQTLHGLGNVHFHRAEYATALEYMYHANELRRAIGDDQGLLLGLNSIGAFLGFLGSFAEAVTYLTDSLEIARRLGDRMNESITLGNLGFLKIECGDPEEAREYLMDSLRLANQTGERVYRARALSLLARANHLTHRTKEALDTATQAVDIAVEIGNHRDEAVALSMLATIQAGADDIGAAEQSLLRALACGPPLESSNTTASIHCELGKLYTSSGNFEAAAGALETGLAGAGSTYNRRHISEMYLALAELHEARRDYKRAFESLRSYNTADRELQRESAQNRMIAQIARLEVEKASQEVELHRIRTVELADAIQQNALLLEQTKLHADQMAQLAITDPLTGLYNRRYFSDYLTWERFNPRSRETVLAVALGDLDHFKQVNDCFSHQIGDEVLRTVARIIQEAVRTSDIVVRLGGEEFVILLPELSSSDAGAICERVRCAIQEHAWSELHPDLRVTISIGIADTTDDHLRGFYTCAAGPEEESGQAYVESLLALADKRLYRAKGFGRNRVEW